MKNKQQTPVNGKTFNEVNYIQHLTGVFSCFYEDERLTPFHISLYMTLFHEWNTSKFSNQVSIARSEMMRISKIGSKNTYIKCLKELTMWGYLKYLPSKNNMIGSKIIMYRFDTTDGIDERSCPENGTVSYPKTGNTGGTALVPNMGTQVGPSLNNKKHINIKNIERKNSSNEFPPNPKNEKIKIQKFTVPDLREVAAYFLEKENTSTETERFFNYFESNGWLVGGKTKMKDWRAAARNWMLNVKRFVKPEPTTSSRLHVNENKRYDIPL